MQAYLCHCISLFYTNMARMHSRKRGRARSKQPLKKTKPIWLRYSAKEIELLIVKLSKEGNTPSKIGIVLRDSYGIPDSRFITKKRITQVLKEHNLLSEFPEDLTALIKKSILLRKHMEENKKDQPSRRGLLLTDSKINRLIKYYKRTGKLPLDWSFDKSKASLLIY